jgi:hypothetical protein
MIDMTSDLSRRAFLLAFKKLKNRSPGLKFIMKKIKVNRAKNNISMFGVPIQCMHPVHIGSNHNSH